MKSTGFTLLFLVSFASPPLAATEIYHWVDENGVAHYSQSAPPGYVAGVSEIFLEDTTPPDYDPAEDRYGVKAQAERMASLRDEMAEKREAQRERGANQQPVIQYPQAEPYTYGSNLWPYYPRPPRPPLRPELPIERPYPTVTLKPPGSVRN